MDLEEGREGDKDEAGNRRIVPRIRVSSPPPWLKNPSTKPGSLSGRLRRVEDSGAARAGVAGTLERMKSSPSLSTTATSSKPSNDNPQPTKDMPALQQYLEVVEDIRRRPLSPVGVGVAPSATVVRGKHVPISSTSPSRLLSALPPGATSERDGRKRSLRTVGSWSPGSVEMATEGGIPAAGEGGNQKKKSPRREMEPAEERGAAVTITNDGSSQNKTNNTEEERQQEHGRRHTTQNNAARPPPHPAVLPSSPSLSNMNSRYQKAAQGLVRGEMHQQRSEHLEKLIRRRQRQSAARSSAAAVAAAATVHDDKGYDERPGKEDTPAVAAVFEQHQLPQGKSSSRGSSVFRLDGGVGGGLVINDQEIEEDDLLGEDVGIQGLTIVLHLKGEDDLVISTDLTKDISGGGAPASLTMLASSPSAGR